MSETKTRRPELKGSDFLEDITSSPSLVVDFSVKNSTQRENARQLPLYELPKGPMCRLKWKVLAMDKPQDALNSMR